MPSGFAVPTGTPREPVLTAGVPKVRPQTGPRCGTRAAGSPAIRLRAPARRSDDAGMSWTVAPEPHDSPEALALWRAYYTEVSDRWYLLNEGRRTNPGELEREITAVQGPVLARPWGRRFAGR